MLSITPTGLRTLGRTFIAGHKPAALLIALAVSATVIASPLAPPSPSLHAGPSVRHRWFQVGKASWYGSSFQGKRTATGEFFNMHSFTCAHRTLPLGSWLRITNLHNQKSTFVRVNDRGPYEANAVVDLSYAAAQKLGLLSNGQVRVEQVKADDPELAHALIAQLTSPETSTELDR